MRGGGKDDRFILLVDFEREIQMAPEPGFTRISLSLVYDISV